VKENKSGEDSSLDSDEYEERNRSFAEVDSDELEGELALSEEENDYKREEVRSKAKKQKASWKKGPARKYRQEIDTNVFQIGFKTLKD